MIKGCIFDLGGTIVDKYSLTPLLSFKQIFINRGITVYHKMITKDMGKNKLNHIESILKEPYVKNQWMHIYNNNTVEFNVHIHDAFHELNLFNRSNYDTHIISKYIVEIIKIRNYKYPKHIII